MKKNKGFTLVELLATIIIIGVLLLVIIPNVAGTLLKSSKKTFTSSAKGILRAADLYFTENVDTVTEGTCIDLTSGEIEFDKNYQIVKGSVCYKGGKATLVNVSDGTYCASGNSDKLETSNCSDSLVGYEVYYNPVEGTTCDSYTDANSATNYKTGCMKWYYFKDNSDGTKSYILDHNTTALVAWNSTGSNSSMKEVQTELDNLVSVSKWKVTPRLITAGEISNITYNYTFNATTATIDDWFYFDSGGHISLSPNADVKSNYAWLFDYTKTCVTSGCYIEDESTEGYWTSTPINDTINATWVVNNNGTLNGVRTVIDYAIGVRPVISF